MRHHTNTAGFTLIEVLIALAILSIALAATMRATAMATTSAEEAKLRTYATWVAQNRAAELTARRVFPGAGRENGFAEMGGINFTWTQTASETPNTAFRKAEIVVARADDGINRAGPNLNAENRTLATLTVYLSRPPSAAAP